MEFSDTLAGMEPAGSPRVHPLSRFERAGYRVQHGGLAFSLGLVLRYWHRLLGPGIPDPSRPEIERLLGRFDDLLRADLDHVERGIYPRSLLFQLPYADYLRALPRALAEAPRILRRSRRGD